MSPEPALDLSPRLMAIAELVSAGTPALSGVEAAALSGVEAPALSPAEAPVLSPVEARVADIGCDHGLLARYLVASGRCELCVATEIDEVVLFGAKRAADARARSENSRTQHGQRETGQRELGGRKRSRAAASSTPAAPSADARISWRAGFGLEPLTVADRIDTIVLAGLGAATIVRILDTPRLEELAPRRLIVQPQTSPAELRRWLAGHGWAIVAETVVRDRGRFYEVAAAERGSGDAALSHPTLTRDDVLAAGPVLLRTGGALLVELWEARRARLERIAASGARGATAELAATEAARARRILAALR